MRYNQYQRKSDIKIARVKNKLDKAEAKGDFEAIAKATVKLDKAENSSATKKAKEYKALLDRSKAMTDKIIKASLEKGYNIHSKDVIRSVNVGRNAALMAISGLMIYQGAPGKQYDVKNEGLGIEMHR